MPFIGGWIGYEYAPEKVVEVERAVVSERVISDELREEVVSGSVFTSDSLVQGQQYGQMIAEEVLYSTTESVNVIFSGSITFLGVLRANDLTKFDGAGMGGWAYSIDFDASQVMLPRRMSDNRSWFVVQNPAVVESANLLDGAEVEVTIDSYHLREQGGPSTNSARVVAIKGV
jgi:hypothetical protein